MYTKGKWAGRVVETDGNGWQQKKQVVTLSADDGETIIAHYSTESMEYPNDETNLDNAARIIQCVNNHEDLVCSLKRVLKLFDRKLPKDSIGRHVCDEALSIIAQAERGADISRED